MASRTRERLIDVARQLFARKGLENTTMNDIATASDRGRRTIYTYFRTKDEIYQAVIEDEANRILSEIESRLAQADTPEQKLKALMDYRVQLSVKSPHSYEVWLKSLFNRDLKRAATVRSKVTSRLYQMTESIVEEGIAAGVFIPSQARRLPAVLTMLIRGSDTSVVRDSEYGQTTRWLSECIDFITQGVANRPTPDAIVPAKNEETN